MEKLTYEQQNKLLYNDMLERNHFSLYRGYNFGQRRIELFLFAKCSANCEYCYLQKHRDELYPPEADNVESVLKNLNLLMDWYLDNKFNCDLDIFSSEWLGRKCAKDIFDIFYNKFKDSEHKPYAILCPTNMSFAENVDILNFVQEQIDRLKSIGIHFIISASFDGKLCDYGRVQHSDEYYQRVFEFLDKNNFRAHPMISAQNIKDWIENWEWWQNTAPESVAKTLMTLEVRDNNWDTESIQELLGYMNYVWDWLMEHEFHNDRKLLYRYMLRLPTPDDEVFMGEHWQSHMPTQVSNSGSWDNRDVASCSLHHVFTVRVGDLSTLICHRTSYENLVIGNFTINEETGKLNKLLECKNVNLQIIKDHLKRSTLPHCENCVFEPMCNSFCLGSSYESYGCLTIPGYTVCRMLRNKMIFQLMKMHHEGFEEFLLEDYRKTKSKMFKYHLDMLENLKDGRFKLDVI